MKLTIAYDKQGGQVKNLVARHQTGIVAGIDPAQSMHWQAHTRQGLPRPTTAGTAHACEDQERCAVEVEQTSIGIQIGQFQLRDYTGLADINLPVVEVGTHA